MADLQEIRKQLYDARNKKAQVARLLFEASEKVKQLENESKRINFNINNQNKTYFERPSLEKRLENARSVREEQQAAYSAVLQLEQELSKAFILLSDPSENMSLLDGDYPILLLPLRIETRFRLDLGEFWVRVFPDDCAVDSFEPTLSETEVRNAQAFWKGMWAAGGNETQERAAWRGLVSSHGSGRARWIIDHYGPLNENAKPTKQDTSCDVLLVTPTELKITNEQAREGELTRKEAQALFGYWQSIRLANEPEASAALNAVVGMDRAAELMAGYPLLNPKNAIALAAYWKAIWLAEGRHAGEEAALATFKNVVGEGLATNLIKSNAPFNLIELPRGNKPKADVNSEVVFIVFPTLDSQPTKRNSWSQPAQVNVMPDRLVLLGFNEKGGQVLKKVGEPIPASLFISPDPSGSPDTQMKDEQGNLLVGNKLLWMVDFQRAIDWGLGFRITQKDLTADALVKDGFKRLMVLGVRLSADEQGGKELVQTLLQNHQNGTSGFSLLPQGTPTNNTETGGAGYTRSEDADVTFDTYVRQREIVSNPNADGHILAKYLGLDPQFGLQTLHGNGMDQLEARMMNQALFPGTLGYMLHTLLNPVISTNTVKQIRAYFNDYVIGRGSIPAVRIGNQPYGILPTTVFSRLNWFTTDIPNGNGDSEMRIFLKNLYQRIRLAHNWWNDLSKEVDYIGKGGDAHQILLNILGLHPSSVEYYSRYAESIDHLYNIMNLQQLGDDFQKSVEILIPDANISDPETTMGRLRALGYGGKEVPDLLKLVFWTFSQLLKGSVIDDHPLSETEKIRPYTPDGRNYLKWLADSVLNSLDILRTQSGFTDDKSPQALLYIVTRYALMNAFWGSGIDLQLDSKLIPSEAAETLRKEPYFIHISQGGQGSESRWAQLYADFPGIKHENTDVTITIEQYISKILAQSKLPIGFQKPDWIINLFQQVTAIEFLAERPTARLERLFAEHLDCCSYRLDAWELGLVSYHLGEIRSRHYGDQVKTQGGVYLGAYGWLENVVPENKNLTEVSLSQDLDNIFNPKDDKGKTLAAPLLKDDTNGGYIHAPSLNQAITAAILRNGYLSNATKDNPQSFAVNLSSERVRLALSFIEGIRNGQSLGALLGYQLERGLHDRYKLANNPNDNYTLDAFIFKLRKEFPLQATHLKSTSESSGDGPEVASSAIETLEARNVIDGLSLAEAAKNPDNKTYPFGKSSLPKDITQAQSDAINAEVERLLDICDALADLALAESVHQVAQGNYDRASATLDAYGKSSFPPIPDVIQTPRSGVNLTHRVGLQLEAGLDPNNNIVAPNITILTPRGKGEPALNKWLASILPAPANLVCNVVVKDPVSEKEKDQFCVSWLDLQVQPIDLLYLIRPENEQAMTELDDRVLRYIFTTRSKPPRPDDRIELRYTEPVKDKITFFQIASLIQSLRALVLASRPLQAGDVMLQNQAGAAQPEMVYVDISRIDLIKQEMATLKTDLTAFMSELANCSSALDNLDKEQTSLESEKSAEGKTPTPARKAEIENRLKQISNERATQFANVETYLTKIVNLLERASRFGIPQTGWGFAYAWKAQQFAAILEQLGKLVDRWNKRLADFSALLSDYDQLPATALEEGARLLQRAELLVSTRVTSPLITRDVLLVKQTTFVSKRDNFNALLSTTETSLAVLLSKIRGYLPINELDLVTVEIDEINKTDRAIVMFVADLQNTAQGVTSEIDRRINDAQKKLDEYDAAARQSSRAKALQEAASVLLGDDFHLILEFEPPSENKTEWVTSLAASKSLLNYLTTSKNVAFPVDDWLYGIARVREKLRHWERLVMLTGAFGKTEPELIPIQLPYKNGDSWLALEFPQDDASLLVGDHLLYTAHYASGFDQTKARQCGLLLDEWTEKLPGYEETTGIAFHFDRPNSEPPQVMLLVTSPNESGAWVWQNLVDALKETLDLAKMRAVGPTQMEKDPINRLLPASMLAFTLREISISANLSENNLVKEKIS